MENKKFMLFVFCSAFLMLGTSAYFSIIGVSSLFSGRKFFSGLLAGAMEFSKVTMTSHLTRNWNIEKGFKKIIFIIFVLTLIIFSSIGIYSYLADSYQMTTHKIKSVETELSTYGLQEQILIEEKNQLKLDNTNIDDQINNIKSMNNQLIEQRIDLQRSMNADTTGTINWYGSISRCNKDINTNNLELSNLRDQKKININRIAEINTELQVVWSNENIIEQSETSINAGPLKVLATLFNTNMDTVVRWLLVLIVSIFDPIGVILIVTFNQLQKENNLKKEFTKSKNQIKSEIDEPILEKKIIESTDEEKHKNLVEPNRNSKIEETIINENLINIETKPEKNIYDEQIEDKTEENMKKVKDPVEQLNQHKKIPKSNLDVYVDATGATVIKK